MALPFLRKFQVAIDNNYTPVVDGVAASPARLYIAGWTGATLGRRSKLFVFDWQGNRLTDEEFEFDPTSTTYGISFRNDVIYQMTDPSATTVDVVEYSLSGVKSRSRTSASIGTDFGRIEFEPYAITVTSNFTVIGSQNLRFEDGKEVETTFYPSLFFLNNTDLARRATETLENEALTTDRIRAMSNSESRVFVGIHNSGDKFKKVLAYTINPVGYVAADDIGVSVGETPDNLIGLGWNSAGLALVGDNLEVSLFGQPPPPDPIPPQSIRQYELFDSELEQRFDIVRPGQNNAIAKVLATDVPGLYSATAESELTAQSDEQNPVLLSTVETATIIPRWTLPDVQRNDVIFIHRGDPGVQPTQIPAERWRINSIQKASATKRQVFRSASILD